MAFIINPYIFGGAGYTITNAIVMDGSSDELTIRWPSTPTSVKTGTVSLWLKQGKNGARQSFIGMHKDTSNQLLCHVESDNAFRFNWIVGGTTYLWKSHAILRDSSAWGNLTFYWTAASNTFYAWWNGTALTWASSATLPNANLPFAVSDEFLIGAQYNGGSKGERWYGEMANVIYIDGTAYDHSSFGETNSDTGIFTPIDPSDLTYGNNGFLLNFSTTHLGQDVHSGSFSENLRDLGTELGSIGTDTGHPTSKGAFNGTTVLTEANSARDDNATTGATIGKDWGSGNTNTITAFRVYGPTDDGFIDNTKAATIKLQGSTDNFSSSIVDLHTTASIADANKSIHSVTSGITTSTAYRYHRVIMFATDGSSNAAKVAEVEFYKAGSYGLTNFDATSMGVNNIVVDSPINKDDQEVTMYACFDSKYIASNIALSNNNLTVSGATDGHSGVRVNIPIPSSGVTGIKLTNTKTSLTDTGLRAGIGDSTVDVEAVMYNVSGKHLILYQDNGTVFKDGSQEETGKADWGDRNDTLEIIYDADTGDVEFYVNGSTADTQTLVSGSTSTTMYFYVTGGAAYSVDMENNYDPSVRVGGAVPLTATRTGVGNYCTWNPNHHNQTATGSTLSEGNLKSVGGGNNVIYATHGFSSGKFYAEMQVLGASSWAGTRQAFGIIDINEFSVPQDNSMISTNSDTFTGINFPDVNSWSDGSQLASSYNFADLTEDANDIVCIAVDIDNGKMWVRKNGAAWYTTGSAGNPATGANPSFTFTASGADIWTWCTFGYDSNDINLTDFGQNGFTYAVPSGFKTTHTANLTAPTISKPSDHVDAILYTGSGSELAISSLAFQPDFVWIKNRDANDSHMIYDVCRGATKEVHSDTNDAETTTAQTLKSFDSDGFTLGTDVQVNTSSEKYVAWCFKAGGSPSSNSDGTLTTSVSVNTTAGFSIGTYTADGGTDTLGHGLSATPEFFMVKKRASGAGGWRGYHANMASDPQTDYLELNEDSIAQDEATIWNDTAPTSSVITIGSDQNVSPNTYVFYAWHGVKGYSKFGVYTGNGNADGPFVYLGFQPAFLIVKKVSGSDNDWNLVDDQRIIAGNDGDRAQFYADTNATEQDNGDSSQDLDILSNGFKVRNANNAYNTSGNNFVFAAWANTPFVSNNREF